MLNLSVSTAVWVFWWESVTQDRGKIYIDRPQNEWVLGLGTIPMTTEWRMILLIFPDVTNINVGPRGTSYIELCAGLCDKEEKSDLGIAVEEVEEVCGYKLNPDQLEFVQIFCEGGARKMIYYVGKCCM